MKIVQRLRALLSRQSEEFIERPEKRPDGPTGRVRSARVGRTSRTLTVEMRDDLCPHCGRPAMSGNTSHWCGSGHRW